jgi:hypothetical protein
MLKFASSVVSALAMSQKLVCLAPRVGKAGRPATVGLPRLPNAVPPSDVRRGDLECHACFNKLVIELAEVRVRGTEGVGLHHQQLVVRVVLEFLDTGWGLMLGPASSGGVGVAVSGCFPSATATATGLGSGVGVARLGALGAISGAGFMLAPKGCAAKPGPPGPGA